MPKRAHLIAGAIASLTIATFFLSTVLSELFGSHETVAAVKRLIVLPGLFILVPALAATGGSGFYLSKSRKGRLVDAKKKRMPIIAANGVLILVPCAIYLSRLATSGTFDTTFWVVQAIELLAGATNVALMALNMRDGFKMTGRFRETGAAR